MREHGEIYNLGMMDVYLILEEGQRKMMKTNDGKIKRNHKINRILLLSVFRIDTLFASRILITMKITEYTQYLFDLWMFLTRILLD